jgi:hypothetical protein
MIRHSSISAIAFSIVFTLVGGLVASTVLESVARAAEAGPAAELLERTGQRVKQFWDELSSVACTENLVQEKLDEKGKIVLSSRADFDYFINLRWDSVGMLVDESRLPIRAPNKRAPQGSLLATQGFATLLMIFHPEFQPSYAFTEEGEEYVAGRKVVRVRFLPKNGAPAPAILALKTRDYPIAWQGTAWIDPELAVVVSIDAQWKDPAQEIGLQSLTSQVRYAPTPFRGSSHTLWLPDSAEIEVRTVHQHWRNVHRFTNYRLFSVDVDSKIGDVKQ